MIEKSEGARWSGWLIGLAVVSAFVLTGATGVMALGTIGTPNTGLLVDPYGAVSNVRLPWWTVPDDEQVAPAYPDRVVAVDECPIRAGETGFVRLPGHQFHEAIEAAARRGQAQIRLTFSHGATTVQTTRSLGRVRAEDVLFLYLVYVVVGGFVLWSGMLVLLISHRRIGALAYALLSIGIFAFLATLYDYHTTARLFPLFLVGWIATGVGCVWLAFAFPVPPEGSVGRALRLIAIGSSLVAAFVLSWLIVAPILGRDAAGARTAANLFFVAALSLLSIVVLIRIRGSAGRERAELLSAASGIAVSPLMIAVGALLGGGTFYITLPFLISLGPLSIGYALIRHNILATTAVLTRRSLIVPMSLIAFLAGMLVWRALIAVQRSPAVPAVLPLLGGAAAFAGMLFGVGRLLQRALFTATAKFRPTIEQLSDHLASLATTDEICSAIARIISEWLPAARAVVLFGPTLDAVEHAPSDLRGRLESGERVWTLESPWQRRLLVPMKSLGQLRGALMISPKHQAALYTSDDLVLLETIANLGAVALHHATVLQELEGMRRLEVEATRDEKRLALASLGAEVSHEIYYPLNFIRFLLARVQKGKSIASNAVEIGEEEVARLERMLASLRRLQTPPPRLGPVVVVATLTRALTLIQEIIEEKGLKVMVEVPATLSVVADPDPLLQLLANLLRNAAQAVSPGGSIGVRYREEMEAQVLDVWDDGPGVPDGMEEAIFSPWVTTKKAGSGLGLSIAYRIARTFGWELGLCRDGGPTCFRIRIAAHGGIQ